MPQRLSVTQAPHYSYLNGGETATARQFWLRPTQTAQNGPRIASAIAGMSAGDFVTVWANSADNIFSVRRSDTGDRFNTLDWTPHGVWNADTEQVLIGGRRRNLKFIAYSDVTGDWRELPMPAVLGRSFIGTVHYYGLIARADDGRVFVGASITAPYELDPATETFTALPTPPTTNGGAGASFSWCSDTDRLAAYGGDAQKWMTLEPGVDSSWTTHSTAIGNGQHAIVRYHSTHQRHLLVGGSGTETRAMLVTSDGTATLVTACPGEVHMSDGGTSGSWIAEHPSGCWIVRTIDGATKKIYAAWPNAGLTDVTWVDLGTAPDDGLTYPTLIPYTSSVALIASTTGLYAWALPAVTDPNGGGTGSVAVTLGNASLSSVGALALAGVLSSTLGNATLSATGESTAPGTGSVSATLEDASLVSAGTIAIDGELTATLENAALSSAGALSIVGALSATLEDASLSATVDQLEPISGVLSATLEDVTLEAYENEPVSSGILEIDWEPGLWWKRKPKALPEKVAREKLKKAATVIAKKAEEQVKADVVVEKEQRKAEAREAVRPMLREMPGFDWQALYDEAYSRALNAAVAQAMREQEAMAQAKAAIDRARLLDDEDVEILMALL